MFTDSYQNDENHEWNERGWLENIKKEEICELIYVCAENSCELTKELESLHTILMNLCIGEHHARVEQYMAPKDEAIDELTGRILSEIHAKRVSYDFADLATQGAIEELKERGLDSEVEMTQYLRKKGYDL